MTFNTGNNVPSTDPRDLYDNAENLDKLVNGADPFYADRKGVLRESWAGMENTFDTSQTGRENAFTLSQADKESRFQAFLVSSGYVSNGDYAANVVLAERNEYVAVDAATTGSSPGLYRPNASASLPLTLAGTWATDSASLVLLGDDVLRQELAATSGSDLLGYKARTVAGRLGDMSSVRDYGGAIDALGRNPTIDAQIIAEADEETDTLKAGHLAVAKQLFGVRRHGSVASFRGNVGNEGFSTEVTGLSGGKHLANYGSVDYVTLFMDIADQPYNSWEILDTPTYNAAGFIVNATVGANLKTGMVVRTNHATPYWGFINTYDAGTGQVTLLDGWWIKDATAAATPPSGSGLRINPNSKVWTYNANAILRADGRADTAVIAELGMANFKATARPNGMDLVMLGQSSAEGGAAFLARQGGAIGWQYGFAAKSGSIAGMHSGAVPRGYVAENCTEGVVVGTPDGSGLAMAVRVGGITAAASTTMSLNGKGQIRRLGHNTVIANGQDAGGTLLSLNAGVSLYTTTLNGTLLLPNAGLTDGDTVRIIKPQSTGTMTVSGNGNNIVVASGSVASFGFTGVANLTCVYYQGAWYIGQ